MAATPDWAGIVAAIDALIVAGLSGEAQLLIDRYGESLVRAGHATAIERWNSATVAVRAANPRTLLLRARVLAEQSVLDAVPAFQAAFAAARDTGDAYRAVQAACGLLRAVFVLWGDFRPVEEALACAERAADDGFAHPDATCELECLTGLLAGWLLARPDHPRRGAVAARMHALAGSSRVEPVVRLGAGGPLLAYSQLWVQADAGLALIERLDRVAGDPSVPPGQRLTWEREAAVYYIQLPNPDPQACRLRIDRYEAGLAAAASPHHLFNRDRLHYDLALLERDYVAAEAALLAARSTLDPRLPVQVISLAHMETKLALIRGQYARAQVSAQQAVNHAEQVQVPELIASIYRVNLAMALTFSGEFAGARREVARLLRDGHGRHRMIYRTSAAVLTLVEAMANGEPLDGPINGCLAAIEESGSCRAFTYNRALGAQVMTLALERAIHEETARRVIEAMQFEPPAHLPQAWPWTLRLYLLGTPVVQLDGEQLAGKARAQQRPLDLLAAIALGAGSAGAAGSGRAEAGVDAQALTAALWTDKDTDAKTAFDVTLLRLRKLLRHDSLVLLTEGRLRLDRRRVWCDVWAFEARLDSPHADASPNPADVLGLYRGPLLGELGGESVPGWAAGPRERLRSRYLRAVAHFGAGAEAAADWTGAIALYERGIDEDRLAEDFYRGLMRCHIALGAYADAARAYRRCRELLSIVLSVGPTAETVALYNSIAR